MKYILFSLLLLAKSGVQAQQDFDYKIYTQHMQLLYNGRDSAGPELSVIRHIIKENNHLVIASVFNTGDVQEYSMKYIGRRADRTSNIGIWTFGEMAYVYETEDEQVWIYIWPTIPLVELHSHKTGKVYQRFY